MCTLALAALAACGGGNDTSTLAGFGPGTPPAEMRRGAALFGSYCASCHGAFGTGQGLGPPLLDSLYLSPQFDDAAMAGAITSGARQKHWNYGAMPAVARAGPAEVPEIIGYVRWVQQRWLETAARLPGGT